MVAVTVLLAAVMLTLVLAIVDPGQISASGVMSVSEIGGDEYELQVVALTFSVSAQDARLVVNGEVPPRGLDSYPRSSPYQSKDASFVFSSSGESPLSAIGSGTVLLLSLDEAMRGEEVRVSLQSGNGAVIAGISFIASGTGTVQSIDLGGAGGANGADASGFPLVLTASEEQYVTVPRDNIPAPEERIKISAKVKLSSPPEDQASWATIININGDIGYRLQLSGAATDNRHFEFGAGGSGDWIRSEGVPAIKAGIWYEVWSILDFEDRTMSIWVSNDAGIMVEAGSRDYGRDALPNMGGGDWFIGGHGRADIEEGNERYFDGEIAWIDVQVS